jgi:myo-inositol-1(or 4)-monophosphatase
LTVEALDSLLDFACNLAEEAGQRLVAWFGKAATDTKRDGSVVTEADLDVDRFIHAALRAKYPQHGILSEEGALIYQGVESTWVIDPLDGTTNYANGLSHWGVSIALLHRGDPVLGVLDFPLLQQRFSSARGAGAWLNGQHLRASALSPADLHGNLFFTTDSRAFRFLDVQSPLKARILGSAAFDLAAVATGAAVACIETTPKVWDLAAAWLIVQEAGAVVDTLWPGVPVFPLQAGQDYSGRIYPLLFAANSQIWQTLRAATRVRPGAERYVQRLVNQGWVLDLPQTA